jgi:hypothetical protein
MGLKDSYKIFFAVPFDRETRLIYDVHIIPQLQKKYPKKLECIIGNKQIGWSGPYDAIETFKMQNSELFKHFITQIRKADIIIADLTDNNPNVHVELGIALSYNKNVLRVTQQSYERLGFDVRNYEVEQYRKEDDLLNTIEKYLSLFFRIKDLDFEDKNSNLYCHSSQKKVLSCWTNENEKQKIIKETLSSLRLEDSKFQMRDGKIRVTFNILDQIAEQDWFGVYLRVGSMGFLYGSILVYVRKNGKLEIATYPGTRIVKEATSPNALDGHKTLIIELEGDYIRANIDDINLDYSGLNVQSSGAIIFACHNSNTEYWDVQMVCRDTIETFDKLGIGD